MADGSATGLSFVAYDPSQSAQNNAQNMVNNQNQNYTSFLSNLPGYQNTMNSQAVDAGNAQYNSQKQSIDQNANARGLLFSGLKQGAESSAATNAANNTQNQIATNNQNLSNYANQYGNQVANTNISNYGSQVQNAANSYGLALGTQSQNNQMIGGLLGGIGGAVGGIFSDEDLKENIDDGDEPAEQMMDKLEPKKFSYKEDPDKKEQLGVLAQDMEKSPMGKAVVIETPKGKALDIGKTLSAVLAAQSVLHKRLNKESA